MIQLEDLIDVRFVASEITVESSVRLQGRFVESLLHLISRHRGMLMELASD